MKSSRLAWRHADLVLLIAVPLAFIFVFRYIPMFGLSIAFKEFILSVGVLRSPWVGFENFVHLFGSADFPRALRNTIVISMLRLGFGFLAPLVLALLLNELRLQLFKRFVQTITYLPYFFSWVILGGIFLMLLGGEGPINAVIQAAGQSPVSFLGDRMWFIVILIVTGIWQSAGYGAVIYLAALSGIDPCLYEAAAIDGAGRWAQTRHITLPSLTPTIIVLLVLNLGHILNAGFDQIYNMYNPMVYEVADIIDTFVLRRMVSMDFSLATAAGMFKSVAGLILVASANWLANRLSGGEHGVW